MFSAVERWEIGAFLHVNLEVPVQIITSVAYLSLTFSAEELGKLGIQDGVAGKHFGQFHCVSC